MNRRRGWLLLVVAVVSLGLWLARWWGPDQRNEGDAYWYTRLSLIVSGQPTDVASKHAAELTCEWSKHRFPTTAQIVASNCANSRPYPAKPRYVHIFDSRLGYPAIGAALRPIFGDASLPVTSALFGVGAAVLASALALLLGFRPLAGALAGPMMLLLPAGTWLARVGTEAPAAVGVLAVAYALTMALLGRRMWVAAAVWSVGVAWTFAVRPPTGVAVAAASLLVVALALWRRRDRRWAVAAVGILAVLGILQLILVLTHAAGIGTTIDDLASAHFTRPAPHPYHVFSHMFRYTFGHWLQVWWTAGLFWTLAVIGACVWLARRYGLAAAGVLALLVVGIASAVVHPIYDEVPRLLSVGEAPVALGLADIFAVAALMAGARWTRSKSA